MCDHEIRTAAENILRADLQESQTNYLAEISHSHSINTIASLRPEYVISPDLFAGQRMNGRMSSVRRFFCLFVTFDLLFTSLMWLICILLNGDNVMTALSKQISNYHINSSLFDVVMLAFCRFVILLFFYALLSFDHWSIIALSTTCTCAFLIAKVFVYDWQTSAQPVFQVLLVLISFVLSWGEAWFFDFRVIPQEFHARQFLISTPETERAPLIRSYVQGLPSMYTESIGNFYSPMGSREPSVCRFDPSTLPRGKYQPVRLTQDEEDNYTKLASKIITEWWEHAHSENWEKLKENDTKDTIQVMTVEKKGKIHKLSGTLAISATCLLQELYYKVENIPIWNPAVVESHKVQMVTESSDICYHISAPAAGGSVSGRDFVSFRHWRLIDECYIIANTPTEHPSLPKSEKYIRGEGSGCWIIQPDPNNQQSCNFEWVIHTDMKGWIPQYVLDRAYHVGMFDYVKSLRLHIEKLNQTGRIA